MPNQTDELLATLTDRIVETIETGNHGKWTQPWTTVLANAGVPTNVTTKKAYHGMNAMIGMFETAIADYRYNLWATYKQWRSIDAQVRGGEIGTKMIKWGKSFRCDECGTKGRRPCKVSAHKNSVFMWASAFTVFNADQVDGYEVPEIKLGNAPEALAAVDEFIAATGANIRHLAQDRAYFSPSHDRITLPLREQFETTQAYYGTALHELTHWSGGESRLDRKKGRTFGDNAYAFEELVAELGSAFLGATLGIEIAPNAEHEEYLASWIKTMKAEPKALYNAAKYAQATVEFLEGLQPVTVDQAA